MREIRNKNLSQNKLKGSVPKTKRKCQKAEKKGFIMKKTISGYAVDHAKKTITLTKAYAKMANTPGTKEFDELAALYKAFPNYTIKMRTAKPNKDKEKHDGLTIARMEFFIKNYKDEIAIAEFAEVKKFYKGTSGYYGKVKGWFLNKYPNYQEIDFADIATSQKSEEEASAAENTAEQANAA